MKKIETLFKKDPNNLGRVLPIVNLENHWVYDEPETKATRKFDGTACAVINGELYKRYDCKKGKLPPEGAIPCQEPDEITGHWPHWVKCERDKKEDQYFLEAFDFATSTIGVKLTDGTYELCGPKINGNKEQLGMHFLIKHGAELVPIKDLSFEGIRGYLSNPENDIEGIVFHGKEGQMCKIRKSDFGIKR